MSKPVIFAEGSRNSKISGTAPIAATYAPIKQTCSSKDCKLKDSKNCYAMGGNTYIHVQRIEKGAEGMSGTEVNRAEAKAIRASFGGGKVGVEYLRIHASGEFSSRAGAKAIDSAAGDFKRRGAKYCFSYSHSWRWLDRKIFKNISVLASVESVEDIKKARKRGYAAAIVLPFLENEFPNGNKVFEMNGEKIIPCPAQTSAKRHCSDCRLCMDAQKLFERKMSIGFAAHGVKKNNLKKSLTVLNG